MSSNLEKRVNLLTGYAVISTFIFSLIILSSFSKAERNEKFDVITAKRINLIGEDGSLRMVMSNETRQHPGRMNGKDCPKRERPAGMLFFNNEGDECGGMVFAGTHKDGNINSGFSFTMDNYHDDQVIQLLNDEEYVNGKSNIQRGLMINEFPLGSNIDDRNAKFKELEKISNETTRNQKMQELWDKEGSKKRLFLGRSMSNSSGLFLYDSKGKAKLKIYVDDKGNPKFETLDDKGNVKDMLTSK
jgi:hypothetical protein